MNTFSKQTFISCGSWGKDECMLQALSDRPLSIATIVKAEERSHMGIINRCMEIINMIVYYSYICISLQ